MNCWDSIRIQCDFLWLNTHLFHFKPLSKWKAVRGEMSGTKCWILRWSNPRPLFSLTKSVHFFLKAASLGNVCRDTPSVLVFPQFAATHLIPLPLLFPPRSPRGIFHMCLLSLLFKGWRHTPETTETSRYFRTEIKVNTPEQLSRVTLKIFRSRLLHSSTIDYWFYIIY